MNLSAMELPELIQLRQHLNEVIHLRIQEGTMSESDLIKRYDTRYNKARSKELTIGRLVAFMKDGVSRTGTVFNIIQNPYEDDLVYYEVAENDGESITVHKLLRSQLTALPPRTM